MENKMQCHTCAFRDNSTENAWKRERCVIYNDKKPSEISNGIIKCACYTKDIKENRN